MANNITDRERFFDDIQAEVLDAIEYGQVDEGLKNLDSIISRFEGQVDLDTILMAQSMLAEEFTRLNYFAEAKRVDQYIYEQLEIDAEEQHYEVRPETREKLELLLRSRVRLGYQEDDDRPSLSNQVPDYEHLSESNSPLDIKFGQHATFGTEGGSYRGPEFEPSFQTMSVERQPQSALSTPLGGQVGREQPFVILNDNIEHPKQLRRARSFAAPSQKAAGRDTLPVHQHLADTRRCSDDTLLAAPQEPKPQAQAPIKGAAGTHGIASTKTEAWYELLREETHSFVYGKNNRFKGLLKDGTEYERIKIAILDSGIAYTKESDCDKLDSLMDAQDRIAGYRDFIDREDEDDHTEALNDQNGHGTRVAYQLLKTTLTARVYIARVVKKVGERWLPDENAVMKAIRFAATSEDQGGWGVDIINMSFGFSGIDDDIRKAVGFAKSQDVLMFASTSNFGVIKAVDILYPASAPEVISVDAADGLGHPLTLNPKPDADTEKTRFTAPGEGIACPISTNLDDGTSFASPIAAGIAALILEFASQTPLNPSKDVLGKLKQQEGMVAIMRLMTKEKTTEKFRFLVPWELLQGVGEKYGGDGGPMTQRSWVAQRIVNKLRIVFKKPAGLATFPIAED